MLIISCNYKIFNIMRRVVVTGMGMVSPLGLNVQESWGHLLAGRSGI